MIPGSTANKLTLFVEPLEQRLNLSSHSFGGAAGKISLDIGGSATSFLLRGPGEGIVTVDGSSFALQLEGTSDRSSVVIQSKDGNPIMTSLDSTALRAFRLKGIDIEDGGLNFHEGVSQLQMGQIANSQILVGATSSLLDRMTITIGVATDLVVESGTAIRLGRAEALLDSDGAADTWTAPAIQKLRVKNEMQAELEATSWVAALPRSVQRGIQWYADHEEGSLDDWEQGGGPDAGGGVFNTGGDEVEAIVSTVVAHSGRYSARATITGAYQGLNGNRAVRLMRWTDRPFDDGGELFKSPSYFSTWMYIPEDYDPDSYDPVNGGWWNVFQFKSDDVDGVSQPMFSMNIGVNTDGEMVPYLWAAQLETSFDVSPEVAIASGEWVHFEAYYKSTATQRGRITLYQNGQEIIDVKNVQTVLPGGDESVVWGLGNYTNHIEGGAIPGQATIFFDDAVVGTSRVSRFLDAGDF